MQQEAKDLTMSIERFFKYYEEEYLPKFKPWFQKAAVVQSEIENTRRALAARKRTLADFVDLGLSVTFPDNLQLKRRSVSEAERILQTEEEDQKKCDSFTHRWGTYEEKKIFVSGMRDTILDSVSKIAMEAHRKMQFQTDLNQLQLGNQFEIPSFQDLKRSLRMLCNGLENDMKVYAGPATPRSLYARPDPASPGSGSSPIPFTRSRSIADSAPPPLNRTRSNPPTAFSYSRERDSKENGARVESDQIFVNAVLDEPKADDAVQPETKKLHVAIASIRKLQGLARNGLEQKKKCHHRAI